jgi:hypothetical protein
MLPSIGDGIIHALKSWLSKLKERVHLEGQNLDRWIISFKFYL